MSAEQLIALEAAVADLSALYPVARSFQPLQARAENELLPFLARLGARLRQAQRRGDLDDGTINAISTEILGTAAHWNEELSALHESSLYKAVRDALCRSDQAVLGQLVPELLAGYSLVPFPSPLHFPLSITSGRRRPGASPFLDPRTAAEQIARQAGAGIKPDPAHGVWWESELRPLVCASDPTTLGTTVALRVQRSDAGLSVFAVDQDLTRRVFASLVAGPFAVVLAATAEDEWWEAYEDDYTLFRDRLQRELERRGLPVEVAVPGSAPPDTTPILR